MLLYEALLLGPLQGGGVLCNWAMAACMLAPAGHSALPHERMAWIGIWQVYMKLLPGGAAVQGLGGPRIRRIAVGLSRDRGEMMHPPWATYGAAWARGSRERAGCCLLELTWLCCIE